MNQVNALVWDSGRFCVCCSGRHALASCFQRLITNLPISSRGHDTTLLHLGSLLVLLAECTSKKRLCASKCSMYRPTRERKYGNWVQPSVIWDNLEALFFRELCYLGRLLSSESSLLWTGVLCIIRKFFSFCHEMGCMLCFKQKIGRICIVTYCSCCHDPLLTWHDMRRWMTRGSQGLKRQWQVVSLIILDWGRRTGGELNSLHRCPPKFGAGFPFP